MIFFGDDLQQQKRLVRVEKICRGKDVSRKGAFDGETVIELKLVASRKLGATAVTLVVEDDEKQCEIRKEMTLCETEFGNDVYSVKLDFSKLCPKGEGLFLWYFELISDKKTVYVASLNNVDAVVCEQKEFKKFRFLVYDKEFTTPDWAKETVMYQIFVDRFNRGSVDIPCREDAVKIEDWDNGIPEYPPYCGAPMKNNSFFGGTLYGIIEKLDYLCELGVNLIYLCPIFKAYSNHKYDTGDYETVDEMFGGDKAFKKLVKECDKRGVRIILDGVFNHTGDDSKYFNRYGKYKEIGAYQSKESKYYDWYNFEEFPDKYEAWWGIEILPRIDGCKKQVKDYFLSEKGIVRKWLKSGISGWRLDVADELSQGFLEELRSAAKIQKDDSLIIGEVWENAADKVSYGERRRYFRGKQLDSVMNYPIKNAIIDFVKFADAEKFYDSVCDIYSSYPDFCSQVLMNILGTHDTERILTVLGGKSDEGIDNAALSTMRMSEEERKKGKKMLKIASVLQFTLPGMPSIYYGDEAGVEGYHDPFCRMPFPWGREDEEILCHYKNLCSIKREQKGLQYGELKFLYCKNGVVAFTRGNVAVVVNSSGAYAPIKLEGKYTDLFSGSVCENKEVVLSPIDYRIYLEN